MKATKCATLLLFLSLCVQRRTAQTTAQLDTRVCPPTPDGVLGSCGEACEEDAECLDDMKCCPNTCGTQSCRKIDIDIPTTEPPIESGNETTPMSSADNQTVDNVITSTTGL